MHDEINEQFKRFIAEFVAALNNPAISTYIAFGVGAECRVTEHQPKHRLELRLSDDIKRPQFLSVFYAVASDDYYKAWADYTKAQAVLSELLNSYSTVEKLIVDFPEYAKYVPELPPAKNLPIVVVSELRGKLTALGVPVK